MQGQGRRGECQDGKKEHFIFIYQLESRGCNTAAVLQKTLWVLQYRQGHGYTRCHYSLMDLHIQSTWFCATHLGSEDVWASSPAVGDPAPGGAESKRTVPPQMQATMRCAGGKERGRKAVPLVLSGERANPSEASGSCSGPAFLAPIPPRPPAGPLPLPAEGGARMLGPAGDVVFLFVLHTMPQKNILLICN